MSRKENRFGFSISLINRMARGYFTRALKPLGIGPGQQAYLLALQPGEFLIQEELALRLRVDRANVTRAVAALEKQGYIQRLRSGADRRARTLSLTPRGLQVRDQVEQISRELIERLKEPLSDKEWETLEQYLFIVADSLAAPSEFLL